MIALENDMKKEMLNLGMSFAVFFLIFWAAFIKENIITVAWTAASIYWLFVIPGFAIMHHWRNSLEFIERLIMGAVLGLAIVGVVGYNLSVIGLHMKYHTVILPVLMLFAAFALEKVKIRGLLKVKGEARQSDKHHKEED